ncbi:hypothetical protein [Streptomyces sp. H27-D2]|uniref:hypothetical protein n=1 Tax=Streptomyces sp. H27-D2 TaxID=3046304 RepID=UPI002DBDFFAD|nr:hypothetical protein [Streptomyces sp. H27-D2]MEC4020876.1 hypothetical protein [Streptomyces sp. H27-D2]
MRPSYQSSPAPSATPIYDALYSEYLRSFRALPGDRTGEEELGLDSLGNWNHPGTANGYASHTHSSHSGHGSHSHSHSSATGAMTGVWDSYGRQQRNLPAALPPGQRDYRGRGR